jgi:large repetitive protein
MFKRKTGGVLAAVWLLAVLLLSACSQAATAPTPTAVALSISSTSLASGQTGIMYSQAIQAAGVNSSCSWKILEGNLPSGLNLQASEGSINGMPNTAGTFNFTVQVSDGTRTASQPLSITIKSSLIPLGLDTTSLASGEIGFAYSRLLGASGGSGSYAWKITSGALPDGLALDGKAGTITGTPKIDGVFSFTLQVDDGNGASRSQSLNLTIKTPPSINNTTLMNGAVGVDYYQGLTATGGTGTYAWRISKGPLPDGIKFEPQYGELYGPPTTEGTYNIEVQLNDGIGTVARSYSIKVGPPQKPIVIDSAPLANGKVDAAYSQSLKATGGSGTYNWSVLTGALPDGLTLDSQTGKISGTPKTAGTFKFMPHIMDSVGALGNGSETSITITGN